MPGASLDELQAFARRRSPGSHDAYSEAALERTVQEYLGHRPAPIAELSLEFDGRPVWSVFDALGDDAAPFVRGRISLATPPPDGTAWEWLVPFRSIDLNADGSVDLAPLEPGPARRAIGRFALRELYVPRSRLEEEAGDPVAAARGRIDRLLTLPEVAELVRTAGVVPLSATLLVYRSDDRVRFDLDLVSGSLLRDRRAGRLALSRRVRRPPRLAYALDGLVARGELSAYNARALEVLSETHGLSPLELGQVLGSVREFAASALDALAARGLASLDRRTGVYRPRFDPILPRATAPRDEALPPLPNPQLRTSVLELIAAADARATCPLCGDSLPPNWRGIVCARCDAEVRDHPEGAGPA